MTFFGGSTLAIGSAIGSAVAKGLLFADATGLLTQNATKLAWNNTSESLSIGTDLVIGTARLTIYGEDTTGNIMQWFHGAKGVLMSCNGFSPTNLATDFHVNLGGTSKSFAVKEDDAGRAVDETQFRVIGSKTARTAPQVKITQGPTPTSTGYALQIENNSNQAQFVIDKDGKILAAPAGTALPAALGTINIKESGLGYGLMMDNITHYAKNQINPSNLGAPFALDCGGSTTGLSIKKDGVLKMLISSDGYFDMQEQAADPSAPAADHGVLYLKDNGSSKTQLCVRFSSGAVQVIATQP